MDIIFLTRYELDFNFKSQFHVTNEMIADLDFNYVPKLKSSAIVIVDTNRISSNDLTNISNLLENKLVIYYQSELTLYNIAPFEVALVPFRNHQLLAIDNSLSVEINSVIINVVKDLLIDRNQLIVLDKDRCNEYMNKTSQMVSNFNEQLLDIEKQFAVKHIAHKLVK